MHLIAKFSCLPTLLVVKKKKSKGDIRVKPIDSISPSPENCLNERVSKSFPSVDEESSITSLVLSDDSFARAESTEAEAYKGEDERGEIRSMQRYYTDLDHASKTGLNSYFSEKTETDKVIVAGQKPDNCCVAFSSAYSHVEIVNTWINNLDDCSFIPINVEEDCDNIEDEQTDAELNSREIVESSDNTFSNTKCHAAEVTQANNIIQSLDALSTVAHIPGIGLKVIPSISTFACLRTVNLSGNCIVNITPGSLPKSLHTLDLSRNKISTIEGLRDLERLRVLNLSYNRIAKISHGLSNCTLIKELYLAGNKISNVEGLHRLLKLTVLDLSFNKIITVKALSQLVANYNSILALNLLGNPVLASVGNDQLKKEVLNLVPHVTYLNKQPIKPHKVREVVSERVIKAALGDAAGKSKRKLTKRLSQGSSSLHTKSKVVKAIKLGKSRHFSYGK